MPHIPLMDFVKFCKLNFAWKLTFLLDVFQISRHWLLFEGKVSLAQYISNITTLKTFNLFSSSYFKMCFQLFTYRLLLKRKRIKHSSGIHSLEIAIRRYVYALLTRREDKFSKEYEFFNSGNSKMYHCNRTKWEYRCRTRDAVTMRPMGKAG